METLGCVVVAHDALGSEVRRDLFSGVMPELFSLPLAAKQRSLSGHVGGYIGPVPGKAPGLESMRVSDTSDAANVRAFAGLLWPVGNTTAFCDTIEAFVQGMLEMERTVQEMVLQSLGVRKETVAAHLESLVYDIRLSRYTALPAEAPGAPGNDVMYMVPHRDCSTLTTIVHHEVEGLEVRASDGAWITVPPEPGTFTVVAGELFTVVTNGRVPACVHRVRTPSNRERLSVLFGSSPKHGAVVSPLAELVDRGHPLHYGPCDFDEYVNFRFGQQRPELSDTLAI